MGLTFVKNNKLSFSFIYTIIEVRNDAVMLSLTYPLLSAKLIFYQLFGELMLQHGCFVHILLSKSKTKLHLDLTNIFKLI